MKMNEKTKAKLDEFILMKNQRPELSRSEIKKMLNIGSATLHNYKDYVNGALKGQSPTTEKVKRKYTKRKTTPIAVELVPAQASKVMIVYCTPEQARGLLNV